jgi:hypothetical protein
VLYKDQTPSPLQKASLNGWMYRVVEAWAWGRSEEELVDRSPSPWDDATRRPSHADERKALQREVLRTELVTSQ